MNIIELEGKLKQLNDIEKKTHVLYNTEMKPNLDIKLIALTYLKKY
ncbi:MAG TPA: hypothetical protein VIM42_08715 [Clostridium sp.]